MLRASRTIPALVLAVLGLGACTTRRDGPRQTVERYIAAVRANRPEVAYGLLDEKLRRRVSKNDFITRWRAARKELGDQATQLRKGLDRPLSVTARVDYPGGASSRLVWSDGSWSIKDGVTVKVQTATPEDAVRAFIAAVEQRDYHLVMQLVSRSMRESIEHEITDRLSRLKKGLKQKIEVTGNKARLQYDRRYKIELVKENGQWKILDFD